MIVLNGTSGITTPGLDNTGSTIIDTGTANGVAYLNGSKVLTTGSALTFNGTSFGVGSSDYGNAGLINLSVGVAGTTAGGLQLWATNTNSHYVQFGDATAGAAPYSGAIGYNHSVDALLFYTSSTEQMRLTSTGLGIGTSSPSGKLHVVGGRSYFVANSDAFAVSVGYASAGGYYLGSNSANNALVFSASTGVEKMRLDSSGNLGLGVTPSAWGSDYKAFENSGVALMGSPSNSYAGWLMSNAYFNGTSFIYKSTATASMYRQLGAEHSWWSAPSGTAGSSITLTQAMTLDASGRLLLNRTSGASGDGKLQILAASGDAGGVVQVSTNGDTAFNWRNASGTGVGYITIGAASTTYATSSDYRLKENIQPMQNALGVVAQLNPVTYNWKADGSDGQGFIAHELQAVVPDCVTGEKDAVDAEGKPVYQGIDTSFLVATLTKAIQELTARVEQLEAK